MTKEEELQQIQTNPAFAGGTSYGRTPQGIIDLATNQPIQDTPLNAPQPPTPQPNQPPVSTPSAPLIPQNQPKAYTVQSGDTLSDIAIKFNVPLNQISGYRSGDPNKIFPGETLTIGQENQPIAPTPTPQPSAPQPETPQPEAFDFSQNLEDIFSQFNIRPEALKYGFQVNPSGTVKSLLAEVMEATKLPDYKSKLEEIAKGIESIENERDKQIEEINDNPFVSAGTKRERIAILNNQYEKKIANRTNRFKLLEGAYDDARQQAQFAANLAVNLYDKNRNFNQNQLELFMKQAEEGLKAKRDKLKGFELSPGQTRYEYNPATDKYEPIASIPKEGAGGAGGEGITGVISQDVDSIMNGTANLQDFPTKDNYRANVSRELTKKFKEARKSGDFLGIMRSSAVYDKEPGDTFLTSMEKTISVLGQLGALQESLFADKAEGLDVNGKRKMISTGPIVGTFRSKNPWDTKAQTIKAQLNAIVPNLARGVYGEVGVLTDNDIKTYSKTIPNLSSTQDVQNAVLYITVDRIKRDIENKIQTQASGQRDMSGFAETYQNTQQIADEILSQIPGSSTPSVQKKKSSPEAETIKNKLKISY